MYVCSGKHAHAPIEMCVPHGEFAKSVVSANTPAKHATTPILSPFLSPPASQIGRLALQIGIAKVTNDTPTRPLFLLVVQSLANPFSIVVWLIQRVGPSACKEISRMEEYTTSVSVKKLQYLKRASTRQKVPIRSLRREGCDAVVEENKLSYFL